MNWKFICTFLIISIFTSQFSCKLNSESGNLKNTKDSHSLETIKALITESFTGDSDILCTGCKLLFAKFKESDHSIKIKIWKWLDTEICVYRQEGTREMCKGMSEEEAEIKVKNAMEQWMDPDFICPKLNLCPQIYKDINIEEFTKEILKDKPKKDPIKPTGRKTLKLLHISDVHTDVEYKEGTNGACDKQVCCREDSTGGKGDIIAGKWGTYAWCDIPHRTVEKFVDFFKSTMADKIEFAVWTGDNTSHNSWHQSYEHNERNTKMVSDLFKSNFQFNFYPVIGNHESFPVDNFDFFGKREKDFNTFFADNWKQWIGEEAAESLKTKSYYKVYLKKFNLKVIALNSQACNPNNWFLLRDPTDPGKMLKWLRDELYQSEADSEFVYIISHFYSGSCLEEWARVYTALVDRFNHIIRGQFAGHIHSDGYNVYRDGETGRVNNVVFMPGSFTCFWYRNPSYRVYEIDVDTMLPIDYYEYRLDLGKWNNSTDENLVWDLAYVFSKEYNLPDATYDSYHELTERLKTDPETVEKFIYNANSGYVQNSVSKKDLDIDRTIYCGTLPVEEDFYKCMGWERNNRDKIYTFVRGTWRQRIDSQDN